MSLSLQKTDTDSICNIETKLMLQSVDTSVCLSVCSSTHVELNVGCCVNMACVSVEENITDHRDLRVQDSFHSRQEKIHRNCPDTY